MKTLGICIPTYRRPELLRRCVFSAVASAGARPIEISIADDSVSDVNSAVREELTRSFPCVHWHRNDRNLGIDANIQRVVDLCGCDYAWLIGEDDVFLPGAVARMHELVQTLDTPFVFANYRYSDEAPDRVLGTAVDGIGSTVPKADFFVEHLWAIGFIGACVIRKLDWAATDAAPYLGTYYTHVGRIAEMLVGIEAVPVVSEPSVANRVEGHETFTWKKDSYGVFLGFVEMCTRVGIRVPAMASVMELASQRFERKFGCFSLRLAVRLRSEQALDYVQFVKYLRHAQISEFKRLMFLLISVTPPRVFQPLVQLYRMSRG